MIVLPTMLNIQSLLFLTQQLINTRHFHPLNKSAAHKLWSTCTDTMRLPYQTPAQPLSGPFTIKYP